MAKVKAKKKQIKAKVRTNSKSQKVKIKSKTMNPKARKGKAAKVSPVKIKPVKVKVAPPPSAFFSPLNDRVLVFQSGHSDRTPGGLYIPETVTDKPLKGEVLAVGSGRRNKRGAVRPLQIKIGDTVVFAPHSGNKIEHQGREYLILREDEIIGTIEE